jgi:hypothetical protein
MKSKNEMDLVVYILKLKINCLEKLSGREIVELKIPINNIILSDGM